MFALPELNYDYTALEPHIDALTMQIHHTKHHQTYVDKLNAGLAGTEYEWYTNDELTQLVSLTNSLDSSIQWIVRNHWWWHLNHSIFWQNISPNDTKFNDLEVLKEKILSDFWSFEDFQKSFDNKALALFGSGWTWLELSDDKLQITNYPNQENPSMYDKKPILWLDLWEHAYYIKNQNRRPEYISNFWNLVNRQDVSWRLVS